MSLAEKLMSIQTQIKAPKNLYNRFGKYKYRNAEGICEAVKPYLEKYKCGLVISDTIKDIGGRIYVAAEAALIDIETNEKISVMAYARESETKKGMDDSQITGTASSYARKYALNGLLLLDDTKDADSDEHKIETDAKAEQAKDDAKTEEVAKMKIADIKVKALTEKCKNENVPIEKICKLYKVESLRELNERQYRNINDNWKKILEA